MNPRLIKFAVELQTGDKPQDIGSKTIYFNKSTKKTLIDILKPATINLLIKNNR